MSAQLNETSSYSPKYSDQNATEVRSPEVSREMDNLISICEVLEKQVSALEVRLAPVIAQRKEGDTDNQKNPEPVRVPLAQSIFERHRHLTTLSDQLHSIMNRIEV